MVSLNTPSFAPEWKCFIFLETFKRMPHSICPPSTHVTLSAYVKSLSTAIWEDICWSLSVDAFIHWCFTIRWSFSSWWVFIRWSSLSVEALGYPLKLVILSVEGLSLSSWYYFIYTKITRHKLCTINLPILYIYLVVNMT